MNLSSTPYQTPIRRVSGTVTLYNTDTVLECDTSSAPVSITLGAITQSYYSTSYKLYVFDYSSNCATNNITINAGTGTDGSQQKINGANSITLSVDGTGLLIRVMSNTSYISVTATSAAGHVIQDEGVSLTQRLYLNFVGSGVTATDAGGKTVVTIPGATTQGITSLTSAALLALINSTPGTVVPGQFYLVTDGGNSNGGVLVQGVTIVSVTRYGGALYLNADYQNAGSYQSPLGTRKGIWSSVSQSVSVNDVVIYNNSHYQNLTGAWGTAPSGDATNWSVLTKSVANGYILEIDFVEYNVLTNTITYRRDTRGNEVDSYSTSLTDFQWGRDACTLNKVLGQSTWTATNSNATLTGNWLFDSAITETTKTTTPGLVKWNVLRSGGTLSVSNCLGEVSYNEINSAGTLTCGGDISANSQVKRNTICESSTMTLAALSQTSIFTDNTLIGASVITSSGTVTNGNARRNYLSNNGTLTFTELNGFNIDGCEVSDVTAALGIVGNTKTNYKIRKGFSNWVEALDFSDTGIFATTILTIPAAFTYIGIFNCSNTTGKNCTKIINSPTNHEFNLAPVAGQTLQLTSVAVGAAATNEILDDIGGGAVTFTGRTNGTDQCGITRLGTFNGITFKKVWS